MPRKRKLIFALPVLLVLFLVSTAMISGTFAKYSTALAGQDTALVARWSFTGKIGDTDLADQSTVLPIWNHDYSTNIYNPEQADDIIAPGVEGSFKILGTYDSDVDAILTFNFVKSGTAKEKVPIQYSLDNNFSTVYYNLDDLSTAIARDAANKDGVDTPSGATCIVRNDEGVSANAVQIDETVYWRWPHDVTLHNTSGIIAAGFHGSGTDGAWLDADDTAAGIASQAATNRDAYVLTFTVTAEQLMPEA
ncbi:hypothetical protein SAMN02745823_02217 [Sporobacter termitidis DSM 10068]|uniref:Uncharacterized protein n=1 Tax=Sporobacter termitidis DSM 10068 TaxID=1123282 RepID=A0A1M5Y4N8_9FIRM|nr:hypothetical protein [Sporobacter termitidis]SHI06899.1 hypothetical protein SAMN02745823_02217 [Sporobacter termitidis DSM 10068]